MVIALLFFIGRPDLEFDYIRYFSTVMEQIAKFLNIRFMGRYMWSYGKHKSGKCSSKLPWAYVQCSRIHTNIVWGKPILYGGSCFKNSWYRHVMFSLIHVATRTTTHRRVAMWQCEISALRSSATIYFSSLWQETAEVVFPGKLYLRVRKRHRGW